MPLNIAFRRRKFVFDPAKTTIERLRLKSKIWVGGPPKRASNRSNSHSIKPLQKEVNRAESDWAYCLLLNTPSCTEDLFPHAVNWDRAPRRKLFLRRWSWKVECLSPGMGTDYFGWFAGSLAFASANPLARRRHESQMPHGTSWLS